MTHIERRNDGSYLIRTDRGDHYFDNADQALAYYHDLFRRIGDTERRATAWVAS